MPEGDTIFRAARTLDRALAGRVVTDFDTVFPALSRVHDDSPITGRIVERCWSAGKHLLIGFSGDLVLRTQDHVIVYIDPIGKKQSAQFFRISASGSTADGMQTAADDSEDFAPDFDWDAAVARLPDGGGWTAVLRLPFASLRYAPGAQAWRFMVARRLPREQFHLLTSVPIPRGSPSFIATLQPLLGVQLPPRSQFLTVRPSITLRSQRAAAAGGARTRDQDVETSLDVKWRPHPSLLLDAT